MTRRSIAVSLLALIMLAQAVRATPVEQTLIAQLEAQGYHDIAVSRTWLGRILVVALIDGAQREIIINPKTGEILRDYLRETMVTAARDDGDPPVTATTEGAAATVQPAEGAVSVMVPNRPVLGSGQGVRVTVPAED